MPKLITMPPASSSCGKPASPSWPRARSGRSVALGWRLSSRASVSTASADSLDADASLAWLAGDEVARRRRRASFARRRRGGDPAATLFDLLPSDDQVPTELVALRLRVEARPAIICAGAVHLERRRGHDTGRSLPDRRVRLRHMRVVDPEESSTTMGLTTRISRVGRTRSDACSSPRVATCSEPARRTGFGRARRLARAVVDRLRDWLGPPDRGADHGLARQAVVASTSTAPGGQPGTLDQSG